MYRMGRSTFSLRKSTVCSTSTRFLGQPNDGAAVYCCGPGPLLDAVEQRCQRWPKGALHVERLAPSKNKEVPADGEFDIELASTDTRLHVPTYSSMLDVLEENGYEVANSCQAGISSTCLFGGAFPTIKTISSPTTRGDRTR